MIINYFILECSKKCYSPFVSIIISHSREQMLSFLIEFIDSLDNYISDNKMKLGILKLLLLQRDITYYTYLFASHQRGSKACMLKSEDVEVDTIDIDIDKQDVGDAYCFTHRYKQFKAMCIEHGYDEKDMLFIFPSCTRTATLNFSVPMNCQSSSRKFKANLKLVGLHDKYKSITLYSFRRNIC